MRKIHALLAEAQNGNPEAEAQLIFKFEPLINSFAQREGLIDEDCKQHLTIEFILAIRRFDLNRYSRYTTRKKA